jgi:hypothetical protein
MNAGANFLRERTRYGISLVFLLILTAGCGQREFAEVEGTVTLDGQPLADIEVVFLPEVEKNNRGNPSSAYTDEQGRYKLRSERDGKDGTVLGPHRVVLIDVRAQPDPLGTPAPKSRLPENYSSTAQTPLRDIEVVSGKQTFDFNIPKPK